METHLPIPRIGVGVLVAQHHHILLGERTHSHGSGTWCIPGGHLEFGETPEECAVRELKEETGLSALSTQEGPWVNVLFPNQQKHYISLFVIVKEYEGILQNPEPDKCRSWEWHSIQDLPQPLFPSVENLLKKTSLERLLMQER